MVHVSLGAVEVRGSRAEDARMSGVTKTVE